MLQLFLSGSLWFAAFDCKLSCFNNKVLHQPTREEDWHEQQPQDSSSESPNGGAIVHKLTCFRF